MKKIALLAKLQIVFGVFIAAACIFFNIDEFCRQEISVGKNLIACGNSIHEHEKLLNVTSENIFKLGVTLNNVANGCKKLSKKVSGFPFSGSFGKNLEHLHNALIKQSNAINDTQKTFPQTMQNLQNTGTNLKNIGNLMLETAPIKKIFIYLKAVGIILAVIMIINGSAFAILAEKK